MVTIIVIIIIIIRSSYLPSSSSLRIARLFQLQDSTQNCYSKVLCNPFLFLPLAVALYVLAMTNSVPPVGLIAIGDERIPVDA
jgi:Ca2+/Na+ antiporter